MKLVLLGPPGAGKGTQAKLITKEFNIPHISTGDIFRKNIAEMNELGQKAAEYINKGQLVPDDITIDVVEDRLQNEDCKNGFLMDGFPRTVVQADALDGILKRMGTELNYVLQIDVPHELILDRMTGRRVCLNCGATYHIKYNPPKVEGICDNCGNKIIQRKDDSEKTVLERLNIYNKQTQPLIEYYKQRGKLIEIDGTQDIKLVFKKLEGILRRD